MSLGQNGEPVRDTSVSTYYDEQTQQLLKVTGNLRMVHYGLYGPGVETEEDALMCSIHTLVEGCDLGPGKRVLDAGCGLGGPAVALAQQYGVHVTGLTICEPHIAVATEFAKEKGVDHLVDFRHGDFTDMPFPDDSFDAVTNHESFCYTYDKLAYLRGVHRILKPGGHWQMVDGLLSGKPMSEAQEAVHVSMQRAFHMAPLAEVRDLLSTLGQAGFENVWEKNLDAEVAPAADSLSKRWKLLVLLTPPPKLKELSYHELMQGAVDFDLGLREGVFTYRLVSGEKPGQARQP